MFFRQKIWACEVSQNLDIMGKLCVEVKVGRKVFV